jgi:hypothetical protein
MLRLSPAAARRALALIVIVSLTVLAVMLPAWCAASGMW